MTEISSPLASRIPVSQRAPGIGLQKRRAGFLDGRKCMQAGIGVVTQTPGLVIDDAGQRRDFRG
jgi:hypothetical protein